MTAPGKIEHPNPRGFRRGVVLTLVAVAAGCSSAVTNVPSLGDAGSGPPDDSGSAMVPDEGVGFEGGALEDGPSIPQNLVVVHAAPGVPPFRLCFATALPERVIAMLPIPPLPETPSSAPAVPALGPFPAVPSGTPGVFPGSISALPSLVGLPDLSSAQVRPFLVLASSLVTAPSDAGTEDGGDAGAEETCDTLIGRHGLGPIDVPSPGRLSPGIDFWQLETFPVGTFASGDTYLLSVTGCLSSATGSVSSDGGEDAEAEATTDAGLDATVAPNEDAGDDGAAPPVFTTCGASYDGGVNVQMGIARLDTTPRDGGSGVALQFAHRASALEAPLSSGDDAAVHAPASAGVSPAFFRAALLDAGPEAGAISGFSVFPLLADGGPISVVFSPGGLVPSTAETMALDPTDPSLDFGVVIQPLDASTPPNLTPYPAGDVIALPMATIAMLSSWGSAADAAASGFVAGQAYTFVLVGDPAEQPIFVLDPDGGTTPVRNPLYDGRGLHVVAFPNAFTAH